MDRYCFNLERGVRFHLFEKNKLVIRGWYRDDNPEQKEVEFQLDGEDIPFQLEVKKGVSIRQRYLNYQENISEELVYTVMLPEYWKEKKMFAIQNQKGQKKQQLLKIRTKQLAKKEAEIEYQIENESVSEKEISISGWVVSKQPVEIEFYSNGKKCNNMTMARTYRRDVNDVFEELEKEEKVGFRIQVSLPLENRLKVKFTSGKLESNYKTTLRKVKKGRRNGLNGLQKFLIYYKKEGLTSTLNRIKTKVFRQPDRLTYEKWLKKNTITAEELKNQRNIQFDVQPLFSIVIPLYHTSEKYFRELLDSICNQTYSRWELCLADGSEEDHGISKIVDEYQKKYSNIYYRKLEKNLGISENTNAAIEMSAGDYIVLADHDDRLAENALFECAKAISENEQDCPIDILYSDEDKLDMSGKKFFDPNFKSDFNIDLLCSMNYICHLFVVKKELLERVGVLRKEYDGAQDHDFILRCAEQAENIFHIPKILYHWRCHMDSTAANPESKLYAFEAGRKAVEQHYERMNIPAKVEHANFYGMFRTRYQWNEQPLISIIIPNKDHIEDLHKCINSIEEKSIYRNFEFIVVENNSTEEKTFQFYKELEQRENVQVVYYKGGFNFSKINNFGVQFANGEYLLLLNNDTEIINADCLNELLDYCMREDVGIVGAKLCYADDTIQHAGVVIGFGGVAGHTFIESSRFDTGYMGRILCAQDYSAVTAACLMTKKSVFNAVGGLTEELEVAFNDIDYCLKVRETGKLVVYNPYAELYHYESKSRGLEDTPEKVERFNCEAAVFSERWMKILKLGDPYYNPNLTLDKADFSLKM